MKLYYDKRLKDPTYYAQQGIRNGTKTTTRNVKNFGKHSALLQITDDPLAYVKAEIEKMNAEYRVGKLSLALTVDFNEKVNNTESEASASTGVNIGYFYLQDIMKGLRLKQFFQEKTTKRKLTFDCYTISRFLTYARILDPSSKYAFSKQLSAYYEQPEFDYQHILRFMDVLDENYSDYIAWLYKNSNSIVKRDSSVIYYDCTNFYFETEQPDEDYIDEETGEYISGLRKYGISKQHQPSPLVEMGLFMDKQGIPITMCIHPGNTNEQTTALPLEQEVIKMLDGATAIYCADAGLGSYHIRRFNSMGGRAFIVTQSIKKLSAVLKEAVFEDAGYHKLSNNKPHSIAEMKNLNHDSENYHDLCNETLYKEIYADQVVDLGITDTKVLPNGKTQKVKATGILKQRLIVTFSRKMMEYQQTIRNRQIARAKKMLESKDPDEIKRGINDVRRFIKKVPKEGENGAEKTKYEIDMEKIAEEAKYDGYYAVATNLLEDSAKDILDISHQRYKIEECFRIMKTNFSGRPVNHHLPERIRAHFLICYTALLVYRLLEAKLDQQGTHVTPQNLISTLRNMNVVNIHDMEYMALYSGSKALTALTQLSPLQLDFQHYKPKELNGKIKNILQ